MIVAGTKKVTKKRLSLPSSGRVASVKRSCSSVGRDRSDAQDHHHHEDHHDASEPRYTIRRLAHYTSMVGTPSSDTLNNDDTDDNNTNKIDSEKQYR